MSRCSRASYTGVSLHLFYEIFLRAESRYNLLTSSHPLPTACPIEKRVQEVGFDNVGQREEEVEEKEEELVKSG